MKRKILPCAILAAAFPANAALLAHYDFTDGDLLDNEVGATHPLTKVVNGVDNLTITTEGAASFPGDDGDAVEDYLQATGPGGRAAFTVSMWFKPATVDQGGFQGLFSNLNANVVDNFSWQLDVHNGNLRLVSAQTGFTAITNAEAGEPAIQAGVWNHVVVRKINSGGAAEVLLGTETNALQTIGTTAVNPGGLQQFRLGVNRNSDSFYQMEMANVKIYDDITTITPAELNAEGPQLIPEPGTGILALLSLPVLLHRRR